ncbi:hypothetical protein F4782DRAFT_544257 [Xylaria castorea]|nr:hypothetical protein F4782DRAFT_544257 [Xylaria castorea]
MDKSAHDMIFSWALFLLSEDENARTIEQGDESNCKVPGVSFYAQRMLLFVNKNIYTGLKIVDRAEFIAADIIPDPKYPGYHLANNVVIHFGPPLGILLQSTKARKLTTPPLPPGTVPIRPLSHTVDPAGSHFRFLSRKCTRRGLPVVPAFILTNYKAQGKTFVEPSKYNFTGLYVRLSRCGTIQGIRLLGPVQHWDFIGNMMNRTIVNAMQKLKNLADETRRIYET